MAMERFPKSVRSGFVPFEIHAPRLSKQQPQEKSYKDLNAYLRQLYLDEYLAEHLQQLHSAIKTNEVRVVETLWASIKEFISVETEHKDYSELQREDLLRVLWNHLVGRAHEGYTALHLAVLWGRLSIAEHLVRYKPFLNVKCQANGATVFLCSLMEPEGFSQLKEEKQLSVKKQKLTVFQRLIEKDQNPQYAAVNKDKNNILHLAIIGDYFEAFKDLVDGGHEYLLNDKNALGQNGHDLIWKYRRGHMAEYSSEYQIIPKRFSLRAGN